MNDQEFELWADTIAPDEVKTDTSGYRVIAQMAWLACKKLEQEKCSKIHNNGVRMLIDLEIETRDKKIKDLESKLAMAVDENNILWNFIKNFEHEHPNEYRECLMELNK